jgi:hypothetical protein
MRIRHAQHIKSNTFAWQSVQRMQPSQADKDLCECWAFSEGCVVGPQVRIRSRKRCHNGFAGLGSRTPTSSFIIFLVLFHEKGMGKASFESSCFLDSRVPGSRSLEFKQRSSGRRAILKINESLLVTWPPSVFSFCFSSAIHQLFRQSIGGSCLLISLLGSGIPPPEATSGKRGPARPGTHETPHVMRK